ncbi:MAG: hypothetical protein KDB40_00010 [Acidimicrobiales bacterium]|nr:hypothetical protein [Acidimicrobiales bacterium]
MAQQKGNKRERERQRVEKAAAKAARRSMRQAESGEPTESAPVEDQQQVLDRLAELHRRFEAEEIEFDDFAEQKAELTARLVVPDA